MPDVDLDEVIGDKIWYRLESPNKEKIIFRFGTLKQVMDRTNLKSNTMISGYSVRSASSADNQDLKHDNYMKYEYHFSGQWFY